MKNLIFNFGEDGDYLSRFYKVSPMEGVYRKKITKQPKILPFLPRVDFLLVFSLVILVLSVTTTPPPKPGKNFGFFPAVCVIKHGVCGGGK